MASKVASRFPQTLVNEFQTRLADSVESEKVAGTSRYSFLVVSDKFSRKSPVKRQEMVWKIVDESLTIENRPAAPAEDGIPSRNLLVNAR